MNTTGVAYTQNFDSLPSYTGATGTTGAAGSWVDNTTLPGWYCNKGASGTCTLGAGVGGSNAGSLWSLGNSGSTERALGTLASSGNTYYFAARLANNTGTELTALQIGYTGEQWRTGSTGSPQKLQFQYQIADAGVITGANSGTWTAFTALDFTSPNNTTGNAAVDGNAAANRTALNAVLSGISVDPGQEIWIRWVDLDDAGSDGALAVDNLSITPYSDPTLFISDATCAEGDSGTTNCAFTVGLTNAVATDVTFDLATQDAGSGTGYAAAGTDYVATTEHATIPAGSTSYTFNVPVIGNTVIQPNRVFDVQVSNVSGVALANPTGVGTIVDDDTATLSINSVTKNEGDSGTTPFVFTVTLSKTPGSDVTVSYATANGTATSASSDYVAIPTTTMTFLAGTTTLTQTITVNVNGDTTVEPDETFTVNLSNPVNATIVAGTGTGTILNDDALVKSIMAIQGQGVASPFAGASGSVGQLVLTPDPATPTHLNIVTAVKSSGFYMQDSIGDNDTTTSDGIFVFTGSAPTVAVGDAVTVKARVQEFRGSTELTGISGAPVVVTIASSNNPLPAAWDLSAHAPSHDPTTGICANAAINATTAGYQANNFACLDGMRVTVSQGLAVTAVTGSKSYSTTPISDGVHPNTAEYFYATADGTRPMRTPGIDFPGDSSRPDIPVYGDAPEAFEVYFSGLDFDATNFVYNGGTQFHASGIMTGYSSSTTGGVAKIYELYPTTMITDSAPTYPVVVATPEPGKLTVGTQNMLHFFNASNDGTNDSSQYTDTCTGDGSTDQCPTPAEYAVRLQKMSKQIRLTLKAPVVQVVQELENYSTLVDLANQIHSDDASLTYVPYSIRSNDPGGINIGILVRDGVSVDSVTQFFRDTKVTDACNPSFPVPCLLNDRPPVLLDATYQGYRFRVLAIYHRSLGSLAKTGYVGQKRMEQAVQVAGLIQTLQTDGQSAIGNTRQTAGGVSTDGSFSVDGNSTIPLVVLGDFNAYEFSDGFVDVTGIIMGTAVTNNAGTYPCPTYYCPTNAMDVGTYTAPSPALVDSGTYPDPNGAYSYTFNAYSQEIDHIVMTARANQDFVRISHAHGNADASDSADTNNAYGALMLDPTTAVRTSDHDGQVVTLGYVVTATAGSGGSINVAGTSTAQATVGSGGGATFTFIADANYHFGSSSDTCGAGGSSSGSFDSATGVYTVSSVTADCSVSVTFDINSYLVTATVNGSGGSVTPATQPGVTYGSTTTFTAVPDPGYSLASVSGCGASATGNAITTAAITDNCTVTLTFSADPVNGSCGTANSGSFTSLDASSPNLCSTGTAINFSGSHAWEWTWTCSGSNGGNSPTCSANRSFTVTVLAGPHGSITPTSQIVQYGQTSYYTVIPDPGYRASIRGDTCTIGGPIVGGDSWNSTLITADCTLSVTFIPTPGYVPLNSSRILDTRVGANTSDGQFAAGGALTQEQTLDLTILGRGGVPASGVKAVVLNVTVTGPTAPGYITAWPSGTQKPATSNINFVAGQTIPNLVITEVGGNGKVALFNSSGNTDLVADVVGYFTDAADLTLVAPARLLDTRSGNPTVDGLFAGTGAVSAGDAGAVNLTVAGRGGVPATGVGSVILNVTVTNPTAPGYITVWPTYYNTRPSTSNLNFKPGQTIANLVVAMVGPDGKVSLFNSAGSTNLVADVVGWSPNVAELTTLQPERLLDNRPTGATADGQFQGGGPLGPQDTLDLTVTGRPNLPSSGIGAVILNVTVTGTSAPGYLTVWPTGSARPLASNLNFTAGLTIPNLVIVKVGDQGKVSLYNSAGNSYVIADVVGWFPASE